MERSSQGSRLLGFHRAHGITDSRAHAAPRPAPTSPERHVVHGARQQRRQHDDSGGGWAIPLAAVVVLILWAWYIVSVDPTRLPVVDAAPMLEVSR